MIVCIVGPTGVGKTKLSLALAKAFNTELISGDSVQVYKDLDIGSAKVTKEEQAQVTHHMIDILSPEQPFSVALYQTMVRDKIALFEKKGLLPIIVGGTGFYIKSVLHDFNFENSERDTGFETLMNDVNDETLYEQLSALDPQAARKLHPNNRKRVLHALKRAKDGNKISDNQNQDKPLYDYLMIGLDLDRDTLYDRINKRVDQMFEEGLVAEVKALYHNSIHTHAVSAIGYKELYEYFDGNQSLEEAKRLIKRNSRRYAKRQYTYFKNQFNVHWIKTNLDDFDETINQAIKLIKEALS